MSIVFGVRPSEASTVQIPDEYMLIAEHFTKTTGDVVQGAIKETKKHFPTKAKLKNFLKERDRDWLKLAIKEICKTSKLGTTFCRSAENSLNTYYKELMYMVDDRGGMYRNEWQGL